MKQQTFITNNFEETQKLGSEFARSIFVSFKQGVSLFNNRTLALYGDLGAGKTTFVQGMTKGLGLKRRIISPTFVIVRSYNIKYKILNIKNTNKKLKMFYHVDLYRIQNDKELEGLGLQEIISGPENIVVIEWAEKMEELLPKKRIDIKFEYLDGNKRKITITKLT